MYFTQEELAQWKVEDLKNFLQERGVPINSNSSRKAQLIEKEIFAQKLELPVLPNQDARQQEISNSKLKKLNVDGVQIPHPTEIKDNWISGSEYLPSIIDTGLENIC